MRIAGSRHRKSEVKTLGRGYPDTLQVFRMPASKYWNDNDIVPHEWLDSGKPNVNYVEKTFKCKDCGETVSKQVRNKPKFL